MGRILGRPRHLPLLETAFYVTLFSCQFRDLRPMDVMHRTGPAKKGRLNPFARLNAGLLLGRNQVLGCYIHESKF